MSEEWREIPSIPGYAVSNFGQVKRLKATDRTGRRVPTAGRILASRSLPQGHLQVTMSVDGAAVHRLIHRLVAEVFVPPVEGKPCVLHRDDDPANNRPENLFWGTRTENSADMVAKDRQCKGVRVTGAKLDPVTVGEIRGLAAQGVHQRVIARRFGVSQSNVSMIVNRITWGHVQ